MRENTIEEFDFNIDFNNDEAQTDRREEHDSIHTSEVAVPRRQDAMGTNPSPKPGDNRFFSRYPWGKLSLLALSVLIAAKAGLALDRNFMNFSLDGNVHSESLSNVQPSRADATQGPGLTHTLSWLPQSSSGLKFSLPGDPSAARNGPAETVAVVQELMDINLELKAPPHTTLTQQIDSSWLEIDPEMLKSVAEPPDPTYFSQGTEEKLSLELKNNPFSREELLELALMR
ncbi:MAG: hypothetical protein HQL83_01535 [Magnetococcales bacterium]|nr:hypothetical protein [Magnetococcales bacterium]MBF0629880.1 hypothetical protein [Magnetococcales bacterium]